MVDIGGQSTSWNNHRNMISVIYKSSFLGLANVSCRDCTSCVFRVTGLRRNFTSVCCRFPSRLKLWLTTHLAFLSSRRCALTPVLLRSLRLSMKWTLNAGDGGRLWCGMRTLVFYIDVTPELGHFRSHSFLCRLASGSHHDNAGRANVATTTVRPTSKPRTSVTNDNTARRR